MHTQTVLSMVGKGKSSANTGLGWQARRASLVILTVAVGIFATKGWAFPARGSSQLPKRLTVQGMLRWNLEGLLRDEFPRAGSVSAKIRPALQLVDFSCAGDCAPHAQFTRYQYLFAAPGGAAFHLSRKRFNPGYFGNYAFQVTIRGQGVTCNRRETRFLIEQRDSVGFDLACE